MPDVTAKRLDEMTKNDMGFVLARRDLGVSSFGFQIAEFPAGFDEYPSHDESESGQEEVYIVIRGSGTLHADDTDVTLEADVLVRVGPAVHRTITAGPDGLRLICLAGVPGAAYTSPTWTD